MLLLGGIGEWILGTFLSPLKHARSLYSPDMMLTSMSQETPSQQPSSASSVASGSPSAPPSSPTSTHTAPIPPRM